MIRDSRRAPRVRINTFPPSRVSRSLEGRGPDLLYIHGRNNAVTRLKLANPCCSGHCAGLEHLLEIQTANRNAENGIAAVECWPLFLSLSAGRSETKGRGETSKLCEKTGIIEKQGWSSCDIPTATDAGYSSFFPSSFFLFFFFFKRASFSQAGVFCGYRTRAFEAL